MPRIRFWAVWPARSPIACALYRRHSGWVGGLRTTALGDMLREKPERLIMMAVRGMLPKNKLGHAMLKKLKVYAGPEHPHAAQNPQPLTLSL